jgi:hypothetical protein
MELATTGCFSKQCLTRTPTQSRDIGVRRISRHRWSSQVAGGLQAKAIMYVVADQVRHPITERSYTSLESLPP